VLYHLIKEKIIVKGEEATFAVYEKKALVGYR
jgi:hypothetical protein